MPNPVGILDPLLGKDIVVQITPAIVQSGTLVPDTVLGTTSFSGKLDPFDWEVSLVTENISPLNVWNSNAVPYEIQGRYTINEIVMAWPLPVSGNDSFGSGSVLLQASQISFYQYLVFSLFTHPYANGSVSLIQQQSAYVLMSTPQRMGVTKGKNIITAMFELIAVFDATESTLITNPNLFTPPPI